MANSRLDDYEVLEVIGQGCYGKVSRVRRKPDGRVFVWKELEYGKMTSKERELLVGEVNILRKLRHPYIVRYHDHLHDRDAKVIYVVTEYCEGGDLAKLIAFQKLKGETFEERWVWTLLAQLVLALHECHCHRDGPILHRDIKPSNVFLDYNNNAKLGDFGLARTVSLENEPDSLAKTICGTPYYMSPEQMRASRYNDRADIWALGCLIYEVCCLSTPFEGSNQQELAANIIRGQCADLPQNYSNALRTVVASMLAVEPSQRPRVQQLANVQEVSLQIRELTLEFQQGMLKRREDALLASERSLSERMAGLKVMEDELRGKEYELQVWERNLRTSERTMAGLARRREIALDDRERILAEREAALPAREEALSTRSRPPLHSSPTSHPSGSNTQRPPLTRTNSTQSTGSTHSSFSSAKSVPISIPTSAPLSARTPNLSTHRESYRTNIAPAPLSIAGSYSSGAYGVGTAKSSAGSKYGNGLRAYGKENTPSLNFLLNGR
eukprot:comp10624_c0_seq1/m.5319 comp10624_c0_seq1/g.5319  ORF comp10624_c0_seq1/g.5319 comp10624_c0_seq1/m.5319 type:complete len:498 (-) comp10624_c0_seq1:50-1543(-)